MKRNTEFNIPGSPGTAIGLAALASIISTAYITSISIEHVSDMPFTIIILVSFMLITGGFIYATYKIEEIHTNKEIQTKFLENTKELIGKLKDQGTINKLDYFEIIEKIKNTMKDP